MKALGMDMFGCKAWCAATLAAIAMTFGASNGAFASTIALTPAAPVVIDFDRPASAGPYVQATIYYDFVYCTIFESVTHIGCTGTAAPDGGIVTLYDDLDGSGTPYGSPASAWTDAAIPVLFPAPPEAVALMADGVFSLVFTTSIGDAQMSAPYAVLTDAQGRDVRIDGVRVGAVPEPASVALLGLGAIAAFVGARRRRAAPAPAPVPIVRRA